MSATATITRRKLLCGAASAAGLIVAGPLTRASVAADTYGDLLARYVVASSDGINRVDYGAWQRSAADREALLAFLEGQARLSPSAMSPGERFAYWTNLYNGLTLKVVLDAYPVPSIRDIKSSGRLLDFKRFAGPWRTKLILVEGQEMSLDDIEHGRLRAEFRDPRIHYAVNCASLGCPNLSARPWRAAALESDLDAAARAYINHPRGVSVVAPGALRASSLYEWYAGDFGGSESAVIRHILFYADPPLVAALGGRVRIADYAYDWSLNDAPRPS